MNTTPPGRYGVSAIPLTLSFTLCGLTGQKTHRGGLGLGGSVHEEIILVFLILLDLSLKD